MSRNNYDRKTAARYLTHKDQILGRFISSCKKYPPPPQRETDLFLSLSKSIVYQQLSGKAAATIYSRFADLFVDKKPLAVVALEYKLEELRSVGLSRNKALAVLDLAAKVEARELPSRRKLLKMTDEEIIQALCQVRGIGPWTAQIYLIFNLGRADVMPSSDLATRNGLQQLMQLKEPPNESELLRKTAHWSPYRSAAAWYLWLLVGGDG